MRVTSFEYRESSFISANMSRRCIASSNAHQRPYHGSATDGSRRAAHIERVGGNLRTLREMQHPVLVIGAGAVGVTAGVELRSLRLALFRVLPVQRQHGRERQPQSERRAAGEPGSTTHGHGNMMLRGKRMH
jgi:thiamine pyrophosphate-dependent acetolactate synthase large subunit-like protein